MINVEVVGSVRCKMYFKDKAGMEEKRSTEEPIPYPG